MDDLKEIKRMRRNLGMTQKELAARAGVSQSLVAKIETDKIDPGFTKARHIFQTLEELREKKEVKAKELMNKKVVFVQVHDKVKTIIQIMKKKGLSQLPVLAKDKVCGLVTESSILKTILEKQEKINVLRAEDIMEEAPPLVPKHTGIRVVSELLKDHPVVLVTERGEVQGIISKTDLLGRTARLVTF